MKKHFWIAGLALLATTTGVWAEPTNEGRLGAAPDPVITAPVGTAITYQGKLDKNGAPVNGSCNFTFTLHDALNGGSQVGVPVMLSSQTVTNGQFSVLLDFGAGAFNGQARWVSIQVQGPGDAGFTTLTPRQPITPAPYALYALGGPVTGQWANDASGINHGGSVGIGAQSNSSWKLNVDGGTGNVNALYVHNDNALFPTFFVRNFAVGGYGFFDDASSKHFFNGKVGVGVTNPIAKLQSTTSTGGETAVIGMNTGNWVGVYGESQTSVGVWGTAVTSGVGVQGEHPPTGAIGYLGHGNGWGVVGDNNVFNTRGIMGTQTDGVVGIVHSASHVAGRFENDAPGGTALYANGVAKVKTLQILGGADLAERFEASEQAEPGTVMAIDPNAPGRMRVADEAYCKRVAGVVSGAEALSAGVVLGVDEGDDSHVPIALTGRVWVKCDAGAAPIRPGDLLTTAKLPGHAMTATEASRAVGAILGKAMTGLEAGTGMVLVLVSLQ